jgi:hypothetical protein
VLDRHDGVRAILGEKVEDQRCLHSGALPPLDPAAAFVTACGDNPLRREPVPADVYKKFIFDLVRAMPLKVFDNPFGDPPMALPKCSELSRSWRGAHVQRSGSAELAPYFVSVAAAAPGGDHELLDLVRR